MEIIIVQALTLGLISSFHCIGMCGPIALSLGVESKNKLKFHTQNIIYNLGRVFTYSLFGALIGIFGQGINLIGYQNYISIIIGIIMILFVLIPYFNNRSIKIKFLEILLIKIKISLGNYLQKKSISSKFITGFLNGFLPCGAVYIALTASLTAGGILNGSLFMMFFGLGTFPLMFLTVFLGNRIRLTFGTKVVKIFPFVVAIFGIIFILRGLDLGIPYVSPSEDALQLYPKKDCCK